MVQFSLLVRITLRDYTYNNIYVISWLFPIPFLDIVSIFFITFDSRIYPFNIVHLFLIVFKQFSNDLWVGIKYICLINLDSLLVQVLLVIYISKYKLCIHAEFMLCIIWFSKLYFFEYVHFLFFLGYKCFRLVSICLYLHVIYPFM